jgi:shikimate dehydrogenase
MFMSDTTPPATTRGPLPSATTRPLVLLGEPVAHSLSPAFQNAAIRHLDLDAVYIALRCDVHAVAPLIRALGRADAGGNVTVPHKAVAAECIERPTDAVRRTGACNTFWGERGIICGDNTDVAGFRHATAALLPTLAGVRALIVGAGGGAAAAACALLDDGADAITLINRSPDRARILAARLDADQRVVSVVTSVRALHDQTFDLVVNASTVGLDDDVTLPIDLAVLADVGAALDIVYRRDRVTPWVRHARELGVTAADGTEMLLGQGAAAFVHWFGVDAPIDVMRAALRG